MILGYDFYNAKLEFDMASIGDQEFAETIELFSPLLNYQKINALSKRK
jgi:hypothetical protein